MKIVKVASTGASEPIYVCGQKLITVRAGDKSLAATSSEYSIDARVTNSAVVIAGNSKSKENPGVNRLLSVASNALGDYLAKSGY